MFAVLIDGFFAGLLGFLPLLGGLLGFTYMLTRDVVWHRLLRQPAWRGSSLGKRMLGLRVVTLDGRELDWVTSSVRNLPLVAGSLLVIIPVIGPFVGPLVGIGLTILELIYVLIDAEGRRLGDRLAGTQVISGEA